MTSASIPPITRKTSAEAPYMTPIFLWSTVVTQDRHPVVARGRANTPSGLRATVPPEGSARASEGRSTIAMGQLLQRLEVGDEGIDLLVGEVQVRHAAGPLGVHGLLARGVSQPGFEGGSVEAPALAHLVGL